MELNKLSFNTEIGGTRIKFPDEEMEIIKGNTLFSPNFLKFIPETEGFSLIAINPAAKWVVNLLTILQFIKYNYE
ncbi:MAG: hypothetical protein OQJ81_09760 [Melioribacteraceae bacterium]|nr:hypothetical protein [Melioribacteraceae bacterium]